MSRGSLRVYFGVAPGVGKTYAMLSEGARRSGRGADVVVGYFEEHDREQTTAQLRGLPVLPRVNINYRGQTFSEMDLDALLARKPEIVLVDELAHSNVAGMRNRKRWEDVDELLAAGIDVITTMNVQHIESLNDVVERVTGVKQQETVPDSFIRAADQIELVDMSPEALRRRMAHGNIYPAAKIDAALGNYFRIGNLTALRELTLLWVADHVEDELEEYRRRHGIRDIWDTREKIVVALTTAPGEDEVIRRAARNAARNKAKLIGVHVRRDDGLNLRNDEHLTRYIDLLKEFGGTYLEVSGSNTAKALIVAAREQNATQLFLGESDRSRWNELIYGSVVNNAVRYSGSGLDVHVISTKSDESERRAPLSIRGLHLAPLSNARRITAFMLMVVGLPVMTAVLTSVRSSVTLPNALLAYLLFAVVISAVGGIWPAIVGTGFAFFLLDYYFTLPLHHFNVSSTHDVLSLSLFVAIAGIVSIFADVSARRTVDGRRTRREAQGLARMAASILAEEDPLPHLMDDLVSTFRLDGVSLLVPSHDGWVAEATAGASPPTSPVDGDGIVTIALNPGAQLVAKGPVLAGEDEEVLRAFGSQLAVALETRRLQRESEVAIALAKANELRSGLLSAVSHDLRTPLSSIKAAATSLLSHDVNWSDNDRLSLLHTINSESDRLNEMVADLLDMSRIRAGALVVQTRPISIEEVIASLLEDIPNAPGRVEIQLPQVIPLIQADPVLLQRVLVNVVNNALQYSPPSTHVQVTAASVLDWVHIRVIDSGPGIPDEDRDLVFRPFQRQDDVPEGHGVGLGLAISKGFVEAMNGELIIEDSPGGGATLVVVLPAAP